MMMTAGRNKGRFIAIALGQLEPENAAVKIECRLQISHLQMHMPNSYAWIDRFFLYNTIWRPISKIAPLR
jgi:hypothetical protein